MADEKTMLAALKYHEEPSPGKICVKLTTPAETQEHLALAYSPGVAEPVRHIAQDPLDAYRYTIKGNLVAVISNGSAILGLGNLGALASKPVMEGKALLFKRFADIDSIDIEVDESDPQAFIDTVRRISCSFGGINLEDIKAPECFEIEQALIEQCDIPVFHDDQHGTAIVTAAGMLNALEIRGTSIEQTKIICSGAGASAISCMRMLILCGAQRENIFMYDSQGLIHNGRDNLNQHKIEFANGNKDVSILENCKEADVFLGLSSNSDSISKEMLDAMNHPPIVFACSNPDPEIRPDYARALCKDIIIATGRSDFPNQVNNVLGFPFIFRGALDVRASIINDEMKLAAVHAIRNLAKLPVPQEVLEKCPEEKLEFGKDYIIPKPLDPRLLKIVSGAVAKAADESGAARKPYDPSKYENEYGS